MFNPYVAGTKVVDTRTDMLAGRQDCNIGGKAPKTEIMKRNQNGRNSRTRTVQGR